MSQHSKRYKAAKAALAPGKAYEPKEAVDLIKAEPQPKFDASVEVHLRLGVDVKQANQQVRGSVVLPNGIGKTKRVAVFCAEDKQKAAKEAGATLVGGEELVKEIQTTGKCDFDVAVATPEMMKLLAPIAKILGQKGLMPNPKTETITPDVAKAVENLNKGKVSFKADDTGNVHQMIGKLSFDAVKLLENLNTFVDAVKRVKPSGAKGTYIMNATLTTTMGPAVKVHVSA
jgi:large subunit ribosomal protein L1